MRVTVFGLGEAGSLIASDLARAGMAVHGYDPAPVATPDGITRHDYPGPAATGSGLVLALTAAEDAEGALAQALDEIDPDTVYADLSTSAPTIKETLAATANSHGLSFADVALIGTVPGNGLATPALASGPGARRYAAVINGVGGKVEVIGDNPGDAAARKLLRSVVTKGLTALLNEAMEAAEKRDDSEWVWEHLVGLLTDADETLLKRFISGTPQHVERRLVEMKAAQQLLESLDVAATMTAATVESLRRVKSAGTGH
jgi:3-hydroxyisobutyrate dehydrogenase-like beta-hydroxyacid dehydrogenase